MTASTTREAVERFNSENPLRESVERARGGLSSWRSKCPLCDSSSGFSCFKGEAEAWKCHACGKGGVGSFDLGAIQAGCAQPNGRADRRGYATWLGLLRSRPLPAADVQRARAQQLKDEAERAARRAKGEREKREKGERLGDPTEQANTLWEASGAVSNTDEAAALWRSYNLDPEGAGSTARAIPVGWEFGPRTSHWGARGSTPRMAVVFQAVDLHGNLVASRGRRLLPPRSEAAKSLPSKGGGGVVFVNDLMRRGLAGEVQIPAVVLLEGEKDLAVWDQLRPDLPVVAGVSGMFAALGERLAALGVKTVYLRTDTDEVGDRYALKFLTGAGGRRGRIQLWRPERDGFDDDADRWLDDRGRILDEHGQGDPGRGCRLIHDPTEVLDEDALGDRMLSYATAKDDAAPLLVVSPVGTGKTYQAVRAILLALRKDPDLKFAVLSSQSHKHLEEELLPLLIAGLPNEGLTGLSADELAVIGKFDCPDEFSWLRDEKRFAYLAATDRGYSGHKAACGPCQFSDQCSFRKAREAAPRARVVAGVLHAVHEGSALLRGRVVVIDEDLGGVLVDSLGATHGELRSFVDALFGVEDDRGAEAVRVIGQVEELLYREATGAVERWRLADDEQRRENPKRKRRPDLRPLVEVPCPKGGSSLLDGLPAVLEWIERLPLKDRPQNFTPWLREVAKEWAAGRPARLDLTWREGRIGGEVEFSLPAVRQLRGHRLIALDATGRPDVIERVTGLAPRVVTSTANPLAGQLVQVTYGKETGRRQAIALAVDLLKRRPDYGPSLLVGLGTWRDAIEEAKEAIEDRDENGVRRGPKVVASIYFSGCAGSNVLAKPENRIDLGVLIGTHRLPPAALRQRARAIEPEVTTRDLLATGYREGAFLRQGSAALERASEGTTGAASEQLLGRFNRGATPVEVLVVSQDWDSSTTGALVRSTPKSLGLNLNPTWNRGEWIDDPEVREAVGRAAHGVGGESVEDAAKRRSQEVWSEVRALGVEVEGVDRRRVGEFARGVRVGPRDPALQVLQTFAALPLVLPSKGSAADPCNTAESQQPRGSRAIGIVRTLVGVAGSNAKAATMLGVNRSTLWRWLNGQFPKGDDLRGLIAAKAREVLTPIVEKARLIADERRRIDELLDREPLPSFAEVLEDTRWREVSRPFAHPTAGVICGQKWWTLWDTVQVPERPGVTLAIELTLLPDQGRVYAECVALRPGEGYRIEAVGGLSADLSDLDDEGRLKLRPYELARVRRLDELAFASWGYGRTSRG